MRHYNSEGAAMNAQERFLNACFGKPVDRPPVWIMRQAGRTLPEYLALREKHDFWESVKTPELAAEITLQPMRRFHYDAAIIFSDILVIPAAMGMSVGFSPLSLSPALTKAADISKLKRPDTRKDLGYVERAIKHVRAELGTSHAVLGFSGAPFTLASYMVEGGASKNFGLMKVLSDSISDYLDMQIEASVTAVQLFDTWAGQLAPEDFERFVLPHVKRIVDRVKARGVPLIYYINGIGNLLEKVKRTGADVVGLDWRIDLAEARRRLGENQSVQGNLDPSILFAPEEVISKKVFQMLDKSGGKRHIVNLGHGLMPDTGLSAVKTFVSSVQKWAEKRK